MDGIAEITLPAVASLPHMGHGDALQRRATLRHFFAGPENHLVQTGVRAVLDHTVYEYNPVVIHGPSGTGKSHLALGLAAAWREKFPRHVVLYTAAVDFARELSDAIATHDVDHLRARFRRCSLAVFEDIAQLAGKRAAQQELLWILDELLAAGQWVVMTASAAPSTLTQLLPALRSRLTAGLTVPLSPPGLHTRQALLLEMADVQSIRLSKTVARILAEGLPVTVPELSGALTQLAVAARLDGGVVDADGVRRWLADRHSRHRPTLRAISAATAKFFSLRLSELRSSSRRRPVVTARGVAMYLARRLTGSSLQQIGCYFGDRDHTTVMHACHRTESLLNNDLTVRDAVKLLQEKWRL